MSPVKVGRKPGSFVKPEEKKVLVKLGKRIKEARLEQGVSQEQLAAEADLHRSYMWQLEKGDKNPTLIVLTRLAKALRIDVSWLLG